MKTLRGNTKNVTILIVILIVISVILLITLFIKRDLAEKPIIDVIITSVATIFSGFIAAGVAFIVANMQIKHTLQQDEKKKQKKLYSRIKLVIYELSFITDILEEIIESKESDDLKLTYLKANISTRIWDNISIDLIDDIEAKYFNQTINMYFDLNILLQQYNTDLLKRVFTDSIKIKTQLENFITTNEINPTSKK